MADRSASEAASMECDSSSTDQEGSVSGEVTDAGQSLASNISGLVQAYQYSAVAGTAPSSFQSTSSEGSSYILCHRTGEMVLSGDVTVEESSSQGSYEIEEEEEEDYDDDDDNNSATEAEQQQKQEDQLYQVYTWSRLSRFFLDFHARTWFGQEEFDRTVLVEQLRSVTRYAIVDIVMLVSWIIADFSCHKQNAVDMIYHSSVYTVTLAASATMCILSFFHVLNSQFLQAERGKSSSEGLKATTSREEVAADLNKRLTAAMLNLEGSDTELRWKVLYLPDVSRVFSASCHIKYISYTMTSPREFAAIKTILEYLQAAAEVTDIGDAPSQTDDARSTQDDSNKLTGNDFSEHKSHEQGSSSEGDPSVSDTDPGKNIKLGDKAETDEETQTARSILYTLLNQIKDDKSSTVPDQSSSGPSRMSERNDQRLRDWIQKALNYFSSRVRKDETKGLIQYLYTQIPKQKVDTIENPSTSEFGQTEKALSSDRTTIPGTRKRRGNPLLSDTSERDDGTTGKMSPAKKLRYAKGSTAQGSENRETDVETSEPGSQDPLPLQSGTEHYAGHAEESESVELSSIETKQSSFQAGLEGGSDLPSVEPSCSFWGSETGSYSGRPKRLRDENQTCSMFKISGIGETEHVFHKIPDDSNCTCNLVACAEGGLQPEMELLLKMVNLVGDLGAKIKRTVCMKLERSEDQYREEVLAIKEILKHCFEILRSALDQRETAELSTFGTAFRGVLEEIEESLEKLACRGALAILRELSKTDEEDTV